MGAVSITTTQGFKENLSLYRYQTETNQIKEAQAENAKLEETKKAIISDIQKDYQTTADKCNQIIQIEKNVDQLTSYEDMLRIKNPKYYNAIIKLERCLKDTNYNSLRECINISQA